LEEITKSEQGTRPAWKGFSSQTAYIAYRLMILKEHYDFFPEREEDLLISKDSKIIELVQVKNLSADISLSHLSPSKKDSFFRRCLKNKERADKDIKLRIISFSCIGQELENFFQDKYTSENSIVKKMVSYGYNESEIKWLHKHFLIEKVSEDELKARIYNLFGSNIKTMASPDIAFDVLVNYISNLSREGARTSLDKWQLKLDQVAEQITSANSLMTQFCKTIFPIYKYESNKELDELKEQYLAGINAHPQHIREGLDIGREDWDSKISNSLQTDNIVLIRGASGQGKSTLAYRYLLNNYLESNIFCIEKLVSEKQVYDIIAALLGLSKYREKEIIVYIDVAPYDVSWLWICEQWSKIGIGLKCLITIREEDFRRSSIDYSKHDFTEIELELSKEEAQNIFKRYTSPNFLTFEEAWVKFGESGPFMEFVYLLNQNETLKDKLNAQIARIIQQENNADDWLKILEVISYAGKFNLHVNVRKLFSIIPCRQNRKMLQIFEKEYFVKTSENSLFLEPIHMVRADLLNQLISKDSLLSEKEIIIFILQTIYDSPMMLLVNFLLKIEITSDILSLLSNIDFNSWRVYEGVVKAILWKEVNIFYQDNLDFINSANKALNNSIVFAFGDVSGYLKNIDLPALLDKNNIKTSDQKNFNRVLEIMRVAKDKKIKYNNIDVFFQNSKKIFDMSLTLTISDISAFGFILYWLALRDTYLPEHTITLPEMEEYHLDEYLNLLVGFNHQDWKINYEQLKIQVEPILFEKLGIVYCRVEEDVQVYAIFDISSPDNNHRNYNDKLMVIIDALRKLYPNKTRYSAKFIGLDGMVDTSIPDISKSILDENLPYKWISTMINQYFYNINKHKTALYNWDEVNNEILEIRDLINDNVDKLINGLNCLFSKVSTEYLRKTEECFNQTNKKLLMCSFEKPKCALDKYGIEIGNQLITIKNPETEVKQKAKSLKLFSLLVTFSSDYRNFIVHKNKLLNARIDKKEITDAETLPLTNLIKSIESIEFINESYGKEMSKYGKCLFEESDIQNFFILGYMLTYLRNHNLSKNKSLLYKSKKYINDYKACLEFFFEDKILEFDGVKSIEKISKRIRLLVSVNKIEDICRKIFVEFKSDFQEISKYELEEAICLNYITDLEIKICYKDKIIPGGVIIEFKHMIDCETVEKFISRLIPITENEEMHLNDKFAEACLIIISSYSGIDFLFKYCLGVNKYINKIITEKSFIENIYTEWAQKTEKYLIDIFNETIKSINIIKEHSMNKHDNIVYDADVSLKIAEDYRSLSKAIVSLYEKEDYESILENLKLNFNNLLQHLNI